MTVMLSAGYKPRGKIIIIRGRAGSTESEEGVYVEGQEASNSQKPLMNTGTIPYLCTFSALSGFRVVSTSC